MTRAIHRGEHTRPGVLHLRPALGCAIAAALVLLIGCEGMIGSQSGNHSTGAGGAEEPPTPAVPTSRFYRLSHLQWENTVRDALGLGSLPGLAAAFSKDAIDSFSNDGEALSVSDQLRLDYEQAARTLGERVSRDPAALARLIPSGAPTDLAGRGRVFIREVGHRLHRRPLEDAEVEEYYALFVRASMIDGAADPFVAGVELVLEAMLQSPHFLYRTELATGSDRVRLDDHEIAAKLSYALASSTSDFCASTSPRPPRPCFRLLRWVSPRTANASRPSPTKSLPSRMPASTL